jgi:hypothetical protein
MQKKAFGFKCKLKICVEAFIIVSSIHVRSDKRFERIAKQKGRMRGDPRIGAEQIERDAPWLGAVQLALVCR